MQIDTQRFYRCEASCFDSIACREDRPWGWLYHDLENTDSWDSNHACVTDLTADMDGITAQIEAFYNDLGIVPRVYSAYLPNDEQIVVPALLERGFRFKRDSVRRMMVFTGQPQPLRADLTYKRLHRVDDGVRNIVLSDEDGLVFGSWSLSVLEKSVRLDTFCLLAAYYEGRAVAMASMELLDGFSRVDNVETLKDCRGRGFGTAVMNFLINEHTKLSANTLYLYAVNDTAQRMYRRCGFEQIDSPAFWSAWKG